MFHRHISRIGLGLPKWIQLWHLRQASIRLATFWLDNSVLGPAWPRPVVLGLLLPWRGWARKTRRGNLLRPRTEGVFSRFESEVQFVFSSGHYKKVQNRIFTFLKRIGKRTKWERNRKSIIRQSFFIKTNNKCSNTNLKQKQLKYYEYF